VAVIGAPNAGKSTLTNALVGSLVRQPPPLPRHRCRQVDAHARRAAPRQVTAVSRKTNTTRREALGALTVGDTQLVLYDTPGVVGPASWRGSAHAQRVASAWRTAADADAVLFIVDAARQAATGDARIPLLLRAALDELSAARERRGRGAAGMGLHPAGGVDGWPPPPPPPPAILVLNKVDAIPAAARAATLRSLLTNLGGCHDFTGAHALSALHRSGCGALGRDLLARARPGRWLLPPSRAAERGPAAQALAATTSALFERLHDELPYCIRVRAAGWEEFRNGSVRIEHVLLVPSDAVRRIVVGANGAAIGQLGIAARCALERVFGRRVHLILTVKVSKGRRSADEEGPDNSLAAQDYSDIVADSLRQRGGPHAEVLSASPLS
jgi:GTP-binding protein Era